LKDTNAQPTTTTRNINKIASNNLQHARINLALLGKKYKSLTPPFLLNFKIFHQNVHNCLVDLGASLNVMPYSISRKLIATPTKCATHILYLDRT
jgi:hypothetical protein